MSQCDLIAAGMRCVECELEAARIACTWNGCDLPVFEAQRSKDNCTDPYFAECLPVGCAAAK